MYIHLPAVCPHCAMGQVVFQNIRRAVLTEAVRHGFVRVTWAWCGGGGGLCVACLRVFGTFFCVVFQYF